MKERIYLFSDSVIKRKQNTLYLEKVLDSEPDTDEDIEEFSDEFYLGKRLEIPTGDKKYIPVENIDSIFIFGNANFNSRLIYFLSQHHIPLHVFSAKGSYFGSFVPAEKPISGSILLKQTEYFKNYQNRLYIAIQFVKAAAANSIANLKYYNHRGCQLSLEIEEIVNYKNELQSCSTINEIMGIEGIIKKNYYQTWRKILGYHIQFYKRIKNPPPDMINSLISYGNMIVYAICLNELFLTRLNPEIGFLHEPGDAKYSLVYDIADIFKPIFTDRIIFKLINKNILTEKDFYVKNGFCRIKKEAKKLFILEFEEKLRTKINYGKNKKRLSYRRIIREECWNLIKHIKNEKKYESFKSEW